MIYQIGRCYLDRVSTPDRIKPRLAKRSRPSSGFRSNFRTTPFAPCSRPLLACQKSLAGNEFVIGQFYYKSSHFKAALERFRAVVTKSPDVGYHRQALDHIDLCEKKIAQEKTAVKSASDAPPVDSSSLLPDNS